MSYPTVLGAAGKGSLDAIAPLLLGIGLVVGLGAIAATVFLAAIKGAEATSRGDRSARLRALDELAGLGGIPPEEYEARRATLLNER